MENIETLVDAGAEVTVEPQEPVTEAQTVDVATDTDAERQPQSKEENSRFADMRRQYERRISEREGRLSKLDSVAEAAGYSNIEDMLDAQKAEEAGMTLSEWRAAEQRKAEQRQNDIFESEEYKRLKADFDDLKAKSDAEAVSRQIATDLSEVQKVFPEVKSLDDLGEVYETLIASGTDAVTAAKAAMAVKVKTPKDIGAIGQAQAPVGEHYTPAQVEYYNDHPELVAKMSDKEFARLLASVGNV